MTDQAPKEEEKKTTPAEKPSLQFFLGNAILSDIKIKDTNNTKTY